MAAPARVLDQAGTALGPRARRARLRADIPAALGFVANWRLLLHHDNYFESTGRPPLLLHLWSLGVEEQFYLVWPFVVLAVLRLSHQPAKTLSRVCFAGAVCSSLLMAALLSPAHPSSVYYDTFTHSAGLLIGAGLACATRNRRVSTGEQEAKRRARLGGACLGGTALLLAGLSSSGTLAYRGGIFLASALTGLVVVVAVHPGPVQELLSTAPLRYLGTRSYSMYLWHWPIICLSRPDLDVRLSGWPLLVLRLALIAMVSEASYTFVEQPFRTGRALAAWHGLPKPARTAACGSIGLCGLAAVLLLALVGPPALSGPLSVGSTAAARVHLPGPTGPTGDHPTTTPTTGPGRNAGLSTLPTTIGFPNTFLSNAPRPTTTTTVAPTTTAPPTTAPPATAPPTTAPPTTTRATTPTTARRVVSKLGHDVLAIGDSVLLAASDTLDHRLHDDITVDAVVGRQVWTGIARLAAYRAAGDLTGLKAIVIDLGSNGPMTPSDVTQLRDLAAGVPLLVFVNVRVPQPWQSETNSSLAAVRHKPGVRLVNWYSASATPGALWPDGIHPDAKGQVIYANLVAKALGM
jgi:peptidoglycan/LPS O-acetylase OafA/YrhL